MAFPLKNLFGKKEEGGAVSTAQLGEDMLPVFGGDQAVGEVGEVGDSAFPPGQSPFQEAPVTAAQVQAPSSEAARPPAFPDSASVPLHPTAVVAPAPAAESPFLSPPAAGVAPAAAAASPVPAAAPVVQESSPFASQAAAPEVAVEEADPSADQSPFGAVAETEEPASPFGIAEESPFSSEGQANPAPTTSPSSEPFSGTEEGSPSDFAPASKAAQAPLESPFGAQESPFAATAPPAESAPEIASPFTAESPFASMPVSSTSPGDVESEPAAEAFPEFAADAAAEAPVPEEGVSTSPFELAGSEAVESKAAQTFERDALPDSVAPVQPVEEKVPLEAVTPVVETVAPAAVIESLPQVVPEPVVEEVKDDDPFGVDASGSVEVELPLQLLIKPLGEEVLGFSADKVPLTVMSKVPLSLIKGQLSSGRVTLPLGTVVDGCEPRYHKAFKKADRDSQVVVPIPDLYHYLPEGALAPAVSEKVPEPEPEVEEDLAAIFADDSEPVAAPVAESPLVSNAGSSVIEGDDFETPFPPVSSGEVLEQKEPLVETPKASEIPALSETSPAVPTDPSPFSTPFTAAAANEEAPNSPSELPKKEDAFSAPAEEPSTKQENEASSLPPYSPFSDEPVVSEDTQASGLSLPSFFDIATPDPQAAPSEKITDDALEPFPEPSAFPEPAPDEKASALPPLGPIDSPPSSSPEPQAAPARPVSAIDTFTDDTSLGDIDAMDDLPELGDLDDLFPASNPVADLPHAAEASAPAPPETEKAPAKDLPSTFTDEAPANVEENAADVPEQSSSNSLPEISPVSDPVRSVDLPAESLESAAPLADSGSQKIPVLAPVFVEPSDEKEATSNSNEEEDLSFGIHEVDDPRQAVLRALFGIEGKVDASRAIDLSASLPGIAACIFMGESIDALGAGKLDRFATNGPAVLENARGLIAAMGINDATCFTIRTSSGTMSFFTEGTNCLGVLHKEPRFEPGVREKLTLVASELAAMHPAAVHA